MRQQTETRIIGCLCQFILGTYDRDGNLIAKAAEQPFELLHPFATGLSERVDAKYREIWDAERQRAVGSGESLPARDGREATVGR